MRILVFCVTIFFGVSTANAVVLDAGVAKGNTTVKPTTTWNQTIAERRVADKKPQIEVSTTDNLGNQTIQVIDSSVVAKGLLQNIISEKVTATPPNVTGTANCKIVKSTLGSDGIPLTGKYFACRHAELTGYYSKIGAAATNGYDSQTNWKTATGDADVPAAAFASKKAVYQSFNDYMDKNTKTNFGVTTPTSGVMSGFGYDYVSSRTLPLLVKEFKHMTQKLPNYLNDWAAQSQQAANQFQTDLTTLASTLGITVTNPLPADFSTQVQNALAGLTVPAAQQPLLDTVLTDTGNAITALAQYNSFNQKYTAQQKVYSKNLRLYNNEKGKTAQPALYKATLKMGDSSYVTVTDLYLVNPKWKKSTKTVCKSKVNSNQPGQSSSCYKWIGYQVKSLSNVVNLKATYAPKKPPAFFLHKWYSAQYSHSGRGKVTATLVSPATSGPNPTLLAKYKKAYQAAASLMAQYKTKRDKVLEASQVALNSAKSNFGLLRNALGNAALGSATLADTYTQAAAANMTAAYQGNATATNLASLQNLLNNLSGMQAQASSITNLLVNSVTVADIDQAAIDFKASFDAIANLDGGLGVGDGFAKTTDIAASTRQSGIINGQPSLIVNSKMDSPYRSLKTMEAALTTFRTAMAMVGNAIQAGGLQVTSTAPIPDVKPVSITPPNGYGTINVDKLVNRAREVINNI